tara:strand:- start:1766 stop:2461 length:696 start_codon:yes stop_codon:yes gene_type:complete
MSMVFSQESELGRIAVSRIEGPNKFYSRNFSNKLEQELFNVGFTVVERRDVKKIMDEWKLQSSGVTNDEPIEFEGIANADFLIVGTFTGINDNTGIFATIKMIDIASGQIINNASIDGQINEKNELYTIGIESLIEQLVDDSNSKMDEYVKLKKKKLKQQQVQKELKNKKANEAKIKRENAHFFWRFIIGLIELVVNILEIMNDDEKDKEDKNNRNYNYKNNNRYKTIFKV